MVDITPFRAFYYNFPDIATEPGKLLAPPYDDISKTMLAKLKAEPLNIAHITLGDEGDKYKRASERLEEWVKQGRIIADEGEFYYAYEQTFRVEGRTYQRTGLVALVRLKPLGEDILPHERTFTKAKEDRLDNLRAILGNVEQIFLVYDGSESSIAEILERVKQPKNEVLSFVDLDDVRHRIFRISRENDILQIGTSLKNVKALIADGHHRYETSLKFSEIMDEKTGPGPYDYVLATLVDAQDPGLVLLPTQRLLRSIKEELIERLPDRLSERFDVEPVSDLILLSERLKAHEGCGVLGFWFPKKKSGILAILKPEYCPNDQIDRMDVSILHRYVFEDLLQISSESQGKQEIINFISGTEGIMDENLAEDDYQVICLMNAPTIPEVIEIAEIGDKMPHKSTYFFPKLWSGLLMHLFGRG